MKKALGIAVLLLPMTLAGCSHSQPVAYYPPPPPPAFTQIASQGFHDGTLAAQRDMRAGLRRNVERHPRFRRPPVPPPAWADYRNGFRDGYNQVVHPAPPPPPPPNQ